MITRSLLSSAVVGAFAASAALSVQAQVRITEVAPWGSGNAPYAADWFEVTNFGAASVNLSGWKMDDNSNAFASAVALAGVTTLAPGESAIFVESTTPSTTIASFRNTWFGTAGGALQVGSYGGAGVGLGTGGDAVNLFDAAGVLQARVGFGASPSVAPFASFDNGTGLDGNVTLATLSVAGVGGAFVALNDPGEIGSPGVSPVPEPGELAFMFGGLAIAGAIARRRRAAGAR